MIHQAAALSGVWSQLAWFFAALAGVCEPDTQVTWSPYLESIMVLPWHGEVCVLEVRVWDIALAHSQIQYR